MTLEHPQMRHTRIAKALNIFYERVFHIVHHDLGISKLLANWPNGLQFLEAKQLMALERILHNGIQ